MFEKGLTIIIFFVCVNFLRRWRV